MKQLIPIFFLFTNLVYSQTDFWSHYSLNVPVGQIVEAGDGAIYAVTDSNVLKSIDFGQNWSNFFTAQNITIWDNFRLIHNKNVHNLFIVNKYWGSIISEISTDYGLTWSEFTFPGGDYANVAINSNGVIYVKTDTLYKSIDNGISWIEVNTPVYSDYGLGGMTIDDDDNIYMYRAKRFYIWDPSGYLITTYLAGNMYRSNNSGLDLQYIFPFVDEDGISPMFNVPTNNILFSYNDASFTHHYGNGYNRNFPIDDANWAIFDNNIIKYISSSSQGFCSTSNNGTTWSTENSGLPGNSANSLLRDSLGFLYTGTYNGIYKSNFTSYTISPNYFNIFPETGIADTSSIEITLLNPFHFQMIIDSIRFSNDNFFAANTNLPMIDPGDSSVITLGFAPNIIGTFNSDCLIYFNNISARLKLIGESPTPTMIVLPYPFFGNVQIGDTSVVDIKLVNESVNKIFIDTMYLAFNQFYFIDNYDFPVVINSLDTLSVSVYFIPLGGSIPIKKDSLVIQSNCTNSRISLIVSGRAVNPTNVVNEELISSFNLFESYPNPFNPITTIEYQVPKTSNVKISVFNLVGQEITVLVDEEKVQGKYKVEFNGTKLSSGVYFYKMQSDKFISTKKFVLIK